MKRKVWIMLALAVLVMALCCAAAQADEPSGWCGENLTWYISNETLTIRGNGAMCDYEDPASGSSAIPSWYQYRDQFYRVEVREGVTSVGNNAFRGQSVLSIELPTTLTRIGSNAISNIMTNIYYRGSEHDFEELTACAIDAYPQTVYCRAGTLDDMRWSISNDGCLEIYVDTFYIVDYDLPGLSNERVWKGYGKDITNILFNGRIRTVSDTAFYNLTNLRYIRFRFADSLKTIGYNAFMGCTSLTDVYFDGTPAQWQTVTVQSGNSAITNATMHYSAGTCGGSLKWSLEDGTLSIYGTGAMTNWNSPTATPWANVASFVERIRVGSGVHSIGTYAFASCNACKSVTIEAGPSVIGANAFFTMNSLEHVYYNGTQEQWNSIDIKSGNAPMTSLMQPLQGKCGVQASWKISNNTLTITGSGAMTDYTGTLAPWDDLQECFNKVVINGPTNVGAYAFYLMDDIEEVTLYPSVVDSIRAKAFYGCTKLKSVSGLSRISTIQTQAFAHCTSLTGDSLSATAYVADDAFFDCPKFLCTVTFDLNGRGSPKPLDQVVPKGRKITEPGSPSAQDWIFTGWYRNPDTQSYYPFNFDTDTLTNDMTLYAGWREDTLPVSFVSNGGSGVMYPVFVLRGGTLVLPENAFNPPAGKAFSGWKVNEESSLKQPGDTITVTANVTLTAQWYGPYTVSFQKGTGSGTMDAIQVTPKTSFFIPNCEFTPPAGAVFSGWLSLGDNIILQPGDFIYARQNLTLRAQYAGPFTITFDPVGGSGTMAAVTVGYGEAYTLPECGFTPPIGKKFGNWSVETGDSTTVLWPRYTMTVTQNVTLKPDWRTARATFQTNGGTGILTPVDMVPDSSGYITLPECSLNPPDGRMFAGWLVGGTVYQPGQRAPIYGDTLIPAQWTTAHYTVTYDKNGGSGSMASFTTQGDTFTLPDCGFTPPAGKQFAYWIVPAAVTNYKLYYPGQTVQINADTTVRATWDNERPSSWTVSFTPDEGSGTMPSITVADEAYLTFPECAFTPPAGKIFEHWVLKTADGYYMGTYHPGDQAQIYQDYIVWPYYRNLVTHYVNFYDPSNYNILNTQDIVEGGLVSVPEVSVPGYTLHSWYFRYRPDENSDWVTVPFDFGQPVEFYLALEGDPDGTTISVWAELTQNEHHIALTVSDGGTAQLDPAQDTYHYGDVVYINWEMDSGCHYEGITITPADGESQALDYNYFTMPDCDVAVDVRFLRPVIHSGTFGDGLYWSLNEGSLTIGGVGAMPDFTWENEAPWMAWKNEIYGVEIQSGITAVGSLAFAEISSLGYASLPGTVTRTGSLAFYCCNALGGITLPDGLTVLGDSAFQETAISMVDIPAGVRVIGESAFAGCVNLSSVTLHEGLEEIGDSAFGYCESITEISIPQSVVHIGPYAFDSCTSLQRVSGLEQLGSIPDGLFNECNSLTDIGLLPRVSVIPGDAFARCRSLKSIAIPSTVTTIEDWAFDECDSLTAVYYEGSRAMWDAISIGDYNDGLEHATIYCKLVVSFETNCDAVIPDQLINYGECPTIPETPFVAGSLFTGWYLESSLDTSCDFSDPLYEDTVLYADWFTPDPRWTLRLPDQLVRVESEAFWGVRAETVAVPRGVTYIADDAFSARVAYVLGFPGTAAEDWANAHGAAFIEIDDAWMAAH